MSSQKSKTFNFVSKRSQSISTSKPVSPSPMDQLKTKRSQFAMLASLPFRYAFTNSSSMLMKQTSMIQTSDIHQHTYLSSNLVRNSIDESTSEVGISEENLIKQPSFSSSDIDDYKPVNLVFNREELVPENDVAFVSDQLVDHVLNEEEDNLIEEITNDTSIEGFNNYRSTDSSRVLNNLTLPNKFPDDMASTVKRSAIRRHHSAPQSEAKWLQVCLNVSQNCV